MGSISLSGSSNECGGALSVGATFAYAGLLLQSEPHPLGVPAIGGNEYVWESDRPAKLTIRARAYAYTWGWEPDLGWLADKTLFHVEPPIESERTQPGFRTIARGRELIAQSRDQYGAIDDLVFVRTHLPPSNRDFGKKKVYFEVEGTKVDYADIEVFYPADSKNHPPGGPKGWMRVPSCVSGPEDEIETPNWFFYYWQACGSPERVEYVASNISFYCPYDGAREVGRVFIANDAAPIGRGYVYLFITEVREDACGRYRPLIKEATYWSDRGLETDRLEVRGIHKFISRLEHELAHRRHHEMNIMLPSRGGTNDKDGDWLRDDWELEHCLDPCRMNTTRAFPRDLDGDADVIAEIEAYGALRNLYERKWQEDWANTGLQAGSPPNPFPWKFLSTGTNQLNRDLLDHLPACTAYPPCSCP